MRRSALCVLLLCLSVLVGCAREEVVSQLSQYQANEVMVLLHQHGIEAELTKETIQSVTTFGVIVDGDQMDAARGLLSKENALRPKEPGLQDVFKETGFIPTPQEQKARYLVSLKGEIINALVRKIPDVVDADVLINVPDPEEFGSERPEEPPSASVIVKVRPSEQALETVTESRIQRFVANAVERLDPRNVAVIITYTETPGEQRPSSIAKVLTDGGSAAATADPASAEGYVTIAGLNVREASLPRLKLYLAVFLGVIALLALGLIVMVLQSGRRRDTDELPALPAQDDLPQLEAGEED